MEYYNPNDNSTKRYAAISTLVVVALFVIVACFISITVIPSVRSMPNVIVEFVTPTVDEEVIEEERVAMKSVGDVNAKDKQIVNQPKESPTPRSQEAKGEDEVTENVKPQIDKRALFNNADVVGTTATQTVVTGSNAQQGDTDKSHGKGGGSDFEGYDNLSEGLKNRGLQKNLGQPPLIYNSEGIVVLSVTVAPNGRVISAERSYIGEANVTPELLKLAKEAALDPEKTMFNPSEGETVGTITYEFGLH